MAEVETEAPQWLSPPKQTGSTWSEYGCGPEVYVLFDAALQSQSQVLIRTTLSNTQTGLTITYFLRAEEGQLKVGHSMCSGAFVVRDGNIYEVTFDLWDASSKITTWTGEGIVFAGPAKKS